MAYSEFGTSFKEAYLQWMKDDAARQRAKKLRKHQLKTADETERKRRERVEEEKISGLLNLLAGEDEEFTREALRKQGTPLAEPEPFGSKVVQDPSVGPLMPPQEISVPAEWRDIPTMKAIEGAMPQGKTIEDMKAGQRYLHKLVGEADRAGAPDKARRAALLEAEARMAAEESIADRQTALDISDFNKKAANIATRDAATRTVKVTRDSMKERINLRAQRGESFDDALKEVSKGKDITDLDKNELYGDWAKGALSYGNLSSAKALQMATAQAKADIDAGTPPANIVNPFAPDTDKDRHDAFSKYVKLAGMTNLIKRQELIEKFQDDMWSIGRKRNVDIAASRESPDYMGAQLEFDKWVKGWVSKLPISPMRRRRGLGPSPALIQAEARVRGVDPQAALLTAQQREAAYPQFKDFNYGVHLKKEWFGRATEVEGAAGGQSVDYFTPYASLGTQERIQTKAELDKLKADTERAELFYDTHKGDLNSIAALRPPPSPDVFRIISSMVRGNRNVGIQAYHRAAEASAMDFEHDLRNLGLPAGSPYMVRPHKQGEEEKVMVNTYDKATGKQIQVMVPINYHTKIHPTLGRMLTPAELTASKRDKYKRSGLSFDAKLSRKLGVDIWYIVN